MFVEQELIYKFNITDFWQVFSLLFYKIFISSEVQLCLCIEHIYFMWFFLHYLKQLPGIIIVTFLEELINFSRYNRSEDS